LVNIYLLLSEDDKFEITLPKILAIIYFLKQPWECPLL